MRTLILVLALTSIHANAYDVKKPLENLQVGVVMESQEETADCDGKAPTFFALVDRVDEFTSVRWIDGQACVVNQAGNIVNCQWVPDDENNALDECY